MNASATFLPAVVRPALEDRHWLSTDYCAAPVLDLLGALGWAFVDTPEANIHATSPDGRLYVGWLPEEPTAWKRGIVWHVRVQPADGDAWVQEFCLHTPPRPSPDSPALVPIRLGGPSTPLPPDRQALEMTIYSDDLVRAANHIVGTGTAVLAVYDAIAGSGMASHGLAQLCCGVSLVYSAGIFRDYLRRRDTRIVAHPSGNPGAPLFRISAATGLSRERVASSLQRLVADGLTVSESGPAPLPRAYRLAS